MKKPAKVIELDRPDQRAFRGACLRTGLYLSLTQTMLEMLCAIADDTRPNRFWDYVRGHNKLGMGHATAEALIKRGLCTQIPEKEFMAELDRRRRDRLEEFDDLPERYRLTECGQAVVDLLKTAGIFVESDQATYRRRRA